MYHSSRLSRARCVQRCSARGTCANEKCNCRTGWHGVTCAVPTACVSARIDAYGDCCPSGVLNFDGECCNQVGDRAPILDGDGACCTSTRDACGLCGGSAVTVDIENACCPGMLTPSGLCCASGNVDECGICDGLSTCRTRGVLFIDASSLALSPGDSLPAQFQAALCDQLGRVGLCSTITFSVGATAAGTTTVNFDLAKLEDGEVTSLVLAGRSPSLTNAAVTAAVRSLSSNPALGLSVTGVDFVEKDECGDGVCGLTESAGACAIDCINVLGSCPAPGDQDAGSAALACGGNGECLQASGTCECNSGYSGSACEYCSFGFMRQGAYCVPPLLKRLRSPPMPPSPVNVATPPVPESASPPALPERKSGSKAWLWVLLVLLALLLLGCSLLAIKRRRKELYHLEAAASLNAVAVAGVAPMLAPLPDAVPRHLAPLTAARTLLRSLTRQVTGLVSLASFRQPATASRAMPADEDQVGDLVMELPGALRLNDAYGLMRTRSSAAATDTLQDQLDSQASLGIEGLGSVASGVPQQEQGWDDTINLPSLTLPSRRHHLQPMGGRRE